MLEFTGKSPQCQHLPLRSSSGVAACSADCSNAFCRTGGIVLSLQARSWPDKQPVANRLARQLRTAESETQCQDKRGEPSPTCMYTWVSKGLIASPSAVSEGSQAKKFTMTVSTTLHAARFTSCKKAARLLAKNAYAYVQGRRHASHTPPAQNDRHQHSAQHEKSSTHQNAAHLHGREVEVSNLRGLHLTPHPV